MHTEFHKDWFSLPEFVKWDTQTDRHTHRQQGHLRSVPLFFESKGTRIKQYRNC
jgi:hypothetical protein